MKKYIVLIILFVLCFITIAYLKQQFFNNKIVNISSVNEIHNEIPANLRSKYKAEIEYTIKSEVPKSKQDIKNIELEIKKEKNPYNRQTIIDYGITSILFDFYMQLVNITNKYIEIKEDIPPTDWYMELKESITPHLIKNNIDTRRIDSLLDYADKKQTELNKKYPNY